MKIHLIRHTTPDIESGVCYGQADLDLASTFEAEKNALHAKLSMPYDALYTSPLQRCYRLADTIDAAQRATDDRIMEYNFGDWELRRWAELKDEDTNDWMDNFVDQPAPAGDSILSMQARVNDFWTELLKQPYDSVAVVTHSGVQRLIHAQILSTPLPLLFRLQLGFGAVLEIKHDVKSGFQTVRHL